MKNDHAPHLCVARATGTVEEMTATAQVLLTRPDVVEVVLYNNGFGEILLDAYTTEALKNAQ